MLIGTSYALDIIDALQFVAEQFDVVDIAHIEPHVTVEHSVFVLEFELLNVYIHLLRDNLGYLVDESYLVDTLYIYRYHKLMGTMRIPHYRENAVAVAALESVGNGALTLG